MAPEENQGELENQTGSVVDDSDDVSGVDTAPGGEEETLEFDISDLAGGEKKPEAKPTAAPVDAEDKKQDAPKKKESRIRELNRKLRAAENRAEELERLAASQDQELGATRRQNLEQFELRATGAIDQAKKDLKSAIEMGDVDAQVEANDRLSEAKAYLVRIREHKAGMGYNDERKGAEQDRRPPSRETVRDEDPVANPVKDKWVSSNSWFDENSDDHDSDMAAEAQSYASRLERKMIAEGTPELIGGRSYFNNIDKYMRENYPERFDDGSPNRTPPMKSARDGMTTPQRNGALGGGNAGGGKQNKFTLTPQEYEVALSIRNTSAGRNKDGSPMTNQQLAVKYWNEKNSQNEKSNRAIEQQGFKERGIRV